MLGQNLVARDQHPRLGAIKAREFGGVAFADDDPPFPAADGNRHSIAQSSKNSRALKARRGDSCFPGAQKCRTPPRRAPRDAQKRGGASRNHLRPGS